MHVGERVRWYTLTMADLVPTLHRTTGLTRTLRQLLFILAGIATIALSRFQH